MLMLSSFPILFPLCFEFDFSALPFSVWGLKHIWKFHLALLGELDKINVWANPFKVYNSEIVLWVQSLLRGIICSYLVWDHAFAVALLHWLRRNSHFLTRLPLGSHACMQEWSTCGLSPFSNMKHDALNWTQHENISLLVLLTYSCHFWLKIKEVWNVDVFVFTLVEIYSALKSKTRWGLLWRLTLSYTIAALLFTFFTN